MLQVRRSHTGKGCFAVEPIAKNMVILITSTKGAGYYFLRFLNHSCAPNCGFLMGKSMYSDVLYSRTAIRPGEEVTINYKGTRWEHLMEGKECRCKKCEGGEK